MTRAWLLAARPATLWAAVVPVLVGGGLALGADPDPPIAALRNSGGLFDRFRDSPFRWDAFFVTLLAALAIQIAANFANDASDAKRGADSDRIGPARVVAQGLLAPRQVWTGVWFLFVVAAVGGAYLTAIAGWPIIAIGVVSVVATLGYVGGPRPYGYVGLGEVFVFVFFGVVATVGSRYVHDSTAPIEAWLLSVPVGLLATAILVVNNIRDIETDAATGKRTLAVIIGRSWTARLYAGLIAFAFVAIVAFGVPGWTPRGTLLALAVVPLAMRPIRVVAVETAGPSLTRALKTTARLHLVAGALVSVGAALG